MEIQNNTPQSNKHTFNNPKFQVEQSQQFASLLNKTHHDVHHEITAAEEMHKSQLQEKKKVKKIAASEEDSENDENEPIEKTVRKLKKNLKSIIEIEKKYLGLP